MVQVNLKDASYSQKNILLSKSVIKEHVVIFGHFFILVLLCWLRTIILDSGVFYTQLVILDQITTKTHNVLFCIQAWIAQLVAHRIGARVVCGSNPGKGKNFSMKICN